MNSDIFKKNYTLNDIFTKNYQSWLVIPLVCFLMTDIISMIVSSFVLKDVLQNGGIITVNFATSEFGIDYLFSITRVATGLGLFFELIGGVSKLKAKAKLNIDAETICFFAFCILVVISCFKAQTYYNYWIGYTGRGEGVVTVLAYFLIFYFSGHQIKKEKIKYVAIGFFIFANVVINGVTFINECIYPLPLFLYGGDGVCGIFYHFNFYGYYLSISIPLIAGLVVTNKKTINKILMGLVFVLNVVMLTMVNTFGAFLATFCGLIFLTIAIAVRDKKVPVLSISVFVLFLAICIIGAKWYADYFQGIKQLFADTEMIVTDSENAGSAGTDRWNLWTNTIRYIKEKPLLGYGIEGICGRLNSDMASGIDLPHNEYLQYAAYYGIPAVLCYIVGLVAVIFKAVRKRKFLDNATLCCLAAAVGYMVSSCFGNTMYFICPFFFIMLGLSNVHEPEKEELKSENSDPEGTLELARSFINTTMDF